MASRDRALGDPAPDAAWEVWYRDTFDRECPPRCEVSGRGLVRGLVELWARHLFETVRPDGGTGFSSFHLQCGPSRIDIEGPREGALRLRGWVFGTKKYAEQGYVAEADANILDKIAAAHAVLSHAGQTSEPILSAALASRDWSECEDRLIRA